MTREPVLTPREVDFPRWYQDVVSKAELAENGPARGTMVIRPDGYAIWERIQAELDSRIKAIGARNAYFPAFIPDSFLRREADHVEGFSPELAVVTVGGGKELEEPLVVRPTSETVVNAYFARWIHSWRDLPMLVNQWANVVRWELRPRLFLRTTEFLWQEGHTAHATEEEARRLALRVLTDVYRGFMVETMAIPVLVGRKTERERFAGATVTWACEAMMGDGKALQMGTSHELGQGFARVFGTVFQSETGESLHPWQTSWGVSTRLVGGLIMAHGDDQGLRIPPRLAPTQAVVILVRDESGAGAAAERLIDGLRRAGVRAEMDARTEMSFGRRSTEWELKGVPARLEVGPRDLREGKFVLARRDSRTKELVSLSKADEAVAAVLRSAQENLLTEAEERLRANTREVASVEEAAEAAQHGFAVLPWSLVGERGEQELAARSVSVRCLQAPGGGVPGGDGASETGGSELFCVVARAY